jgi:serine/threonine protein kinase
VSDEGRLVAGRYRIIERIGTGAMGAVWKAQDEVLARTVAIKQLLLQPSLEANDAEDARQRTMREGRIAARLHHPNAITVFDVVTDEYGQPCLIMEYLNSTSLAEVLQDRRTLPPQEVARIGAQVAAALKEAHAVGIVHRDIKPGNILLGGNGTVKITDFGISRAKDDVTVTKTGMIAGTPAYLAPEVAIGGNPGPESDIFSLGSTLYAACEGQPPFGLSENTLSLLHAVAAGQINPPRQSGPLASVLAVLLHPDIHHRPTAEESEELLASVARGEVPLGGTTAETQMASMAGMLGGAAPGATVAVPRGAFEEEEVVPVGHSGSLLDNRPAPAGPFYDDEPEDNYAPGTGYPEDDYDGYNSSQRANGALNATRAVPVGRPPAQDDYDHDDFDDDDYDDGRGSSVGGGRERYQTPADDDDDDSKPGAWKRPAIIGGIVVIALIAFGVWVLSPRSANSDSPTVPSKSPTTTSAPSSVTSDVEPTDSTDTTSATTTAKRTTSEKTTAQAPPPPANTSKTTTPTTPTTKTTPKTSTPTTPTTPTDTTAVTPAGP